MIEKQLKKLSKFIKEIDQEKPLDFFCKQIKKIEQEISVDSQHFSQLQKDIHSDLKTMVSQYKDRGVSEEELIILFYQSLLLMTKKHVIHSYAYELGLEPSLYKDNMRLLFKGKID